MPDAAQSKQHRSRRDKGGAWAEVQAERDRWDEEKEAVPMAAHKGKNQSTGGFLSVFGQALEASVEELKAALWEPTFPYISSNPVAMGSLERLVVVSLFSDGSVGRPGCQEQLRSMQACAFAHGSCHVRSC